MNTKRLATILMLAICNVANAAISHHFYGRFSSWDGLPESPISSVGQDIFGRMWVTTRDGVFYYNGEDFAPFTRAGCSLKTASIKADMAGCMWIVSADGVGFYDTFTGKFTTINQLSEMTVSDIDVTPDGLVWLTTSAGIWKYVKETESLNRVMDVSSFTPYKACVTNEGNLAITARNSNIYVLDTRTGHVRVVRSNNPDAVFNQIEFVGGDKVLVNDGTNEIRIIDFNSGEAETIIAQSIFPDNAGVQCLLYEAGLYWIGTTSGLLIYDPATKSVERQFPDRLNIHTLGDENIRCLFSDDFGNVWAGTWNGGLRCCISNQNGLSRFVSHETTHTLTGSTIRAICEAPDGCIWIGSEEGYLCRFDTKEQTFVDYTEKAGISTGTAITDITTIGSLIWISTFGEGILSFDPVKGKPVRHYNLSNGNCLTTIQASDGHIYAGTRKGLYRLNEASDTFELVEIVGVPFVHCIVEDYQKQLIISTYYHGFGIYDLNTASYRKDEAAQQDAFTMFALDSRGVLWGTTDGAGLCKIEYKPDGNVADVKHFDKQAGMPSNSCCSLTLDKDGHLWVATTMGLVEFDPVNEKVIKTYMQADNIIGRNFTFGSNILTKSGEIFLGTSKGLMKFTPELMKERFGHSVTYITDITLGTAHGSRSITQPGHSAITSRSISIKQKETGYISITFSSLDYASPNTGKYDCSLTGRLTRNHLTTDENHVVYSGLKPGSYRFSVNNENSDDDSLAASLDINVLAPWYFSHLACIIYILILGILGYFLMRWINFKKKEESERRMELVEIKKEKDLAHEKMTFFTNIAHEIRTPVSVIQILLDKMDPEQNGTESIKGDLMAISLNVERLKKLCDDLLDFRKIDSGQVRLITAPEDICAILRKSINSFESVAKARNLDINVKYPKEAIISSCDADSIESVICNLLSNAIKHSETLIRCKISEEDGKVVVRVENDGVRVPEEESERIFEAFFQSEKLKKNGTGLGLTYSRKIATMHYGRLYLDTSVKDVNSFVLELPLVKASCSHIQQPRVPLAEEEIPDTDNQRRMVLVVEDNDTMRELIADTLSKDYNTLTASDGEEALEIVNTTHVDIVVSDIMMPRMDGCELCNAIKENINLSHIPVMLLTAAVGVETHIRSLKSGADAYLEKPLKMDILLANISNLLRNRDIRNEQFSLSPLSHYSFSNVSKVEIDFMNAIHSYILDHVSDVNLSLDHLAEAMSVSRATLTRKVKADTGVTVNEYVRICRLKKAVELLSENSYRINEVAYLVGFSSPSYFTSSFQKQFGKLPSEFTKKNTK